MYRIALPLLLGVVLAACAGRPHVVPAEAAMQAPRTYSVHVVNHGWHTGIILAARHIPSELGFLRQEYSTAPYFEFGWGDADFYQADTVTSGLALQAILVPSASVMFVRPLESPPAARYSSARLVTLARSRKEIDSLATFLANSFQYDAEGEPTPTKQGTAAGGRFYRGEGQYTLFNTCNTWTAKALQSSGYPIDASAIITAGALMDALGGRGNAP